MTNPLSQYFRSPELFIALPSAGRWWPDGSLEVPPNGEIAVSSMNGLDDLAMRNAEGLMNGDTTVRVIQSCCPSIKNAWHTPSIDADTIFIAIRIASYGHEMTVNTSCNHCKEELEYAMDLRNLMSGINFPNYDKPVEIDNLAIFLKPASYKMMNLNNQEVYQQQRAIIAMRNQTLTEEEKEKIIKDALQRLTEITVNRMHEYVDKIMTPDGKLVTDQEFIKEFIVNADRRTFNSLKDAIAEKNAEYQIPKVPITCTACGHEDSREVQFDPANFFVQDS